MWMPKVDLSRLYPKSPLVRLGLRSLFFLALCLAPWPGLGGAFARTVNDVGNWWIEDHTFSSGLMLRFEWAPDDIGADKANPAWHSIVRVRSVKTNASTRFALNTRSLLYVPGSVFMSL